MSFPLYYLIFWVLLFPLAKADTLGPNYPSIQDTTYQPNLVVVIGILSVMFVLTILILVYAKLCYRASQAPAPSRAGLLGSSRRFSGIDKSVIESLPFFRFSSLNGPKTGLECAVCLSRFEDVELLRLLPKCNHAFHIACVDRWLEKHATCPLCRDRVGSEDAKLFALSTGLGEELEIVVQRGHEFPPQNDAESEAERALHRHGHKMVVSGFALNNRWSDLRSADLVSLSSEMMRSEGARLGPTEKGERIAKIKEEIEMKKGLEGKGFGSMSRSVMSGGDRRSASEITGLPRSGDLGVNKSNNVVEEIWLPIAKRTVQWFVNRDREETSQLPHNNAQTHRESFDV